MKTQENLRLIRISLLAVAFLFLGSSFTTDGPANKSKFKADVAHLQSGKVQHLRVAFQNATEPLWLTIKNQSGEEVFRKQYHNKHMIVELEITSLGKGTYDVAVDMDEISIVKKIELP